MAPDAIRLERDILLRDGSTVHMRAIRPDDTERLYGLHARLSPEALAFRFFRALPTLPREMAEAFTHVDYENRMALVATTAAAEDAPLIAVVRYERTSPDEAEVAFVVEDRWQGKGIATGLLHTLARYARARGLRTLVALTMAENVRMLDVLRHCGFPCTFRYADGDVEGRLDITEPPQWRWT